MTRTASTTPFVDTLLAWGDAELRDLPWRRTRDPWAILVSETMLQQTQVSRVVPRWHDFLEAFPTPADCAAAPAGEVVRLWDGLGYNRRAANLHRAATVIAEQHGGLVPADLDDLLALPGVGPYTARAVLTFALERDGRARHQRRPRARPSGLRPAASCPRGPGPRRQPRAHGTVVVVEPDGDGARGRGLRQACPAL